MNRRAALAGALLGFARAARADDRPVSIFDGRSLSGWTRQGGIAGNWRADGAELACRGAGKDWLATNRDFDDFELTLDYRLEPGGNSGVLLRAPRAGDPSFAGLEVQLLDDAAPAYRSLQPWQYTGSIYGVSPARRGLARPAGEWNAIRIRCEGSTVRVVINDEVAVEDDLSRHPEARDRHPGIERPRGAIGLQSHETPARFRDIRIRAIRRPAPSPPRGR